MKKIITASLVLIATLCASSAAATSTHDISPYPLGERGVLTHRAVAARLQPVGSVCVKGEQCGTQVAEAGGGSDKPRTGKEVYSAHCSVCHGTGAAGAPRFGTADWKPRIAKGLPTLYQHAMNGFNAMPPKGMCSDCSEEEIENAVKYMVNNSK